MYRYALWTMQSGYHNVPDISGQMQQDGRQYTAWNVVYEATPGQVSFSLDIQDAYPEAAKVSRYRRGYEFNRSGKAWLLLRDEYAFQQEDNEVAVNLMCWQRPEVVAEGLLKIPLEDTALYGWFPAGCAVEIIHLDTPDYKLNAVWGDQGIHRITLRYQGLPQNGSIEVLFCQGDASKAPSRPDRV